VENVEVDKEDAQLLAIWSLLTHMRGKLPDKIVEEFAGAYKDELGMLVEMLKEEHDQLAKALADWLKAESDAGLVLSADDEALKLKVETAIAAALSLGQEVGNESTWTAAAAKADDPQDLLGELEAATAKAKEVLAEKQKAEAEKSKEAEATSASSQEPENQLDQ